jgi:hypothetical protein
LAEFVVGFGEREGADPGHCLVFPRKTIWEKYTVWVGVATSTFILLFSKALTTRRTEGHRSSAQDYTTGCRAVG